MPSVVVAGASGYAGALAAALIQRHPRFDLAAVTSRSDVGARLSDLYPYHRVHMDLEELDVDRHGQADAAIVAYPHGAAAPVVAELRERDVRVVDLSADFRLRLLDVYEHWYVPHPHPELLSDAVYGLPELRRAQIEGADIVANPGCYPTATLLALAPIAPWLQDVVVDAKSGISGAGRAPTAKTHFVAADENVTPYGVAGHRHAPEIDQELAMLGAPITTTFVPHLMPLDQGELVSCYCTLREPVDVDALYARAYAREPFVELTDQPPGVRDVRDTNYCRIHARFDERTQKAFVFAAIDNLWKGASSQAVQNLNLMFGYDETVGLL
ncbi:MAG TPA: N-acetyl-gamma-glutamyl-phosphate reductase [Solirubrobacteraceae bacterium]|nr:N-acetyl-gamma-glutamyl-phosphate reductase [Solirubrobacteraceae bacterium]